MEVIIVVSRKQRGVIQDLHREVWSPSGELWPGYSIVIKRTLKKSLETSIRHIIGRLKFLCDRQLAIHPAFLLQVQDVFFARCQIGKTKFLQCRRNAKQVNAYFKWEIPVFTKKKHTCIKWHAFQGVQEPLSQSRFDSLWVTCFTECNISDP